MIRSDRATITISLQALSVVRLAYLQSFNPAEALLL
jgi:hypothetical protein